jgi:hypothetical protein
MQDLMYFWNSTEDESVGEVFVRSEDYNFEQVDNDFYVKLIKANFPTEDRNGDPYTLTADSNTIYLKGDIERIN